MNEAGMFIAVIVAAVISMAAIFWVVWPLLRTQQGTVILEDDRLAELQGRKDAALRAIKELEFDYQVGKIDENDYRRMDQRLRRQAIGLIQQIEKVAPVTASSNEALDEALEAEIAKRRRHQLQSVPPNVATSKALPANGDAHQIEPAKQSQGRFCTNCGTALEPNHKFCANCGTPVVAQAAPAEQSA